MRTRTPTPAAPVNDGARERLLALYRQERVAMVRLAHLLTGSLSTAEDLVHDAFVRVHPVPPTMANPGAYLRRTVINLCHSHHRRRGVERRWLDRQPPPDLGLPPELDEVWTALAALPERQRQALVLRFYLDLRIDDIAEVLEVPAGTVKSTLHRGLAALSKEISR